MSTVEKSTTKTVQTAEQKDQIKTISKNETEKASISLKANTSNLVASSNDLDENLILESPKQINVTAARTEEISSTSAKKQISRVVTEEEITKEQPASYAPFNKDLTEKSNNIDAVTQLLEDDDDNASYDNAFGRDFGQEYRVQRIRKEKKAN